RVVAGPPRVVEELHELLPALVRPARRRSGDRLRERRFEPRERLTAAAGPRERLVDRTPRAVPARQPRMPHLGEALVALLEPGEVPHEVVDAGLPELNERRAAQSLGSRAPQRARAGVGHGARVLALRGELCANDLCLVHGSRSKRVHPARETATAGVAAAASTVAAGRCRCACSSATIASAIDSG